MGSDGATFSNLEKINFDNIDDLKKRNETFVFGKTGLYFLDDHYGFRPSCLHVLLSSTSAGKTSLARKLVTKLSIQNSIVWYATEETSDTWKLKFGSAKEKPNVNNIAFISESKLTEIGADPFEQIKMHMVTQKCKILFFDNITTSAYYNDKRPNEQSEFLTKLKSLCVQMGAAFFLIAHVSSNLPPGRMFTSGDIRGNRSLANISEYWYNLHRLRLDHNDRPDGLQLSVIHVEKARSHKNSDRAYQICYSESEEAYTTDSAISWGVVKDLFKKNIKIGGS